MINDILFILRRKILFCQKCKISNLKYNKEGWHKYSGKMVGNGSFKSIMFVGQNPSLTRDGPFNYYIPKGEYNSICQMFFDLVEESLGLKRKDYYFANVISCSTPGNRQPNSIEINNCSVFLNKEIMIIKPKVIITLGSIARERFNGKLGKLTKYLINNNTIPVIATYHPCFTRYRGDFVKEEMKKHFGIIKNLV